MNNILTFSGWGQTPDSLTQSITDIPDAVIRFFDYSIYGDHESAFKALSLFSCDIAIGWSLGGQIALRAIAQNIITPRHLILLGTPFQFSQSSNNPEGAPPEIIANIRAGYLHTPKPMLLNFSAMICQDDVHHDKLLPMLRQYIDTTSPHWLYWLDELIAYSCTQLDTGTMPPTTIFHGIEDRVIPVEQSNRLASYLPHTTLHQLAGCGHAPHLHDPNLLNNAILHVISS